jgi:hypothetical protein
MITRCAECERSNGPHYRGPCVHTGPGFSSRATYAPGTPIIHIRRDASGWIADYRDTPDAGSCLQACGTTAIPLPLTAQATATDALEHMRRLPRVQEMHATIEITQ